MKWSKYASGRENTQYTSPAVGKLRVNILGNNKRPDWNERDSGLEYAWRYTREGSCS